MNFSTIKKSFSASYSIEHYRVHINSLGSEAGAAEPGGGTTETGGGAAEAGGGVAEAGGGAAEGRGESLPTIQHLVGSLANLTNKFSNIYRHACSHTQYSS
jgi:hypothetical protein